MFERMGDSAPKPALYGNDYKKVTLRMMLDHNINEFTQDFEELSTAAAKQHGLLKAMRNMKADFEMRNMLSRNTQFTRHRSLCRFSPVYERVSHFGLLPHRS